VRSSQTPGLTTEVLGAVIAQIDPLVTVLVEEKLEESRLHDMCIGEISSAGLRIEEKNTSLEELNRQKTQVELSITQTAAEISSVESEISALETSLNQTAAERQRTHAEYRAQVQDQEAVMGLLHDAINIMQSFYAGPAAAAASFLQLGFFQEPEEAPPTEEAPPVEEAAPAAATNETSNASSTPAPLTAPTLNGTAPTFAPTKKHDSSQGVVSILEILLEEAESTIQQVVDAEEASQDAYLAEVNSLRASKTLKNKELVTLKANHGQQTLRLSELEGSIETVTTEMSNLNTYLVTVHAKCDLLVEYFSQNQAARDSEIQALRDAKAFLAGKVQTGGVFLQQRKR
jgi:chromosome segregation ATPase